MTHYHVGATSEIAVNQSFKCELVREKKMKTCHSVRAHAEKNSEQNQQVTNRPNEVECNRPTPGVD